MTSFTDRYVDAVTAQLPAGQRKEIAHELRATIADTVEGRPTGVSAEEAERAALVELGHPTLLADNYRGSQRALIGPRVYPAWLAMLKLLLSIVPAVVAVIVFLVALSEGRSGVAALMDGLLTAAQAAMQVGLWVTVAFAVVERTDTDISALAPLTAHEDHPWVPEDLPDPAPRRIGWGEGVAMIVGNVVGIVFVSVFPSKMTVGDGSYQLLSDAALAWRWCIVAGFVLGLIAAAYVLIRGRWSVATASINLLANLLVGAPVITLLLTGTFFDQAAAGGMGPEVESIWTMLNLRVIAGVIAVILLWDTIDAFRGVVTRRRPARGAS